MEKLFQSWTRAFGIGHYTIECVDGQKDKVSIISTDVLYAPALKENLIAVSKLAKKNVKTEIDDEQCRFVFEGGIIATAEIVNGLCVKFVERKCVVNY